MRTSKQPTTGLTSSPQRVSSLKSFNFHLPYDVSCDLVLSAAKEYFNSAGSLMDKDMDLARYINLHCTYMYCNIYVHVALLH